MPSFPKEENIDLCLPW